MHFSFSREYWRTGLFCEAERIRLAGLLRAGASFEDVLPSPDGFFWYDGKNFHACALTVALMARYGSPKAAWHHFVNRQAGSDVLSFFSNHLGISRSLALHVSCVFDGGASFNLIIEELEHPIYS
jgi:hypothetical protein